MPIKVSERGARAIVVPPISNVRIQRNGGLNRRSLD
jgi:hypothetical protein